MTERPLRWGVAGTGHMSGIVAAAIGEIDGAALQAVVGRAPEAGRAFAARHGAPAVHATLDELLADPDVEAVYLGTPNALHADQTRAALAAGKHVLCDKPLAFRTSEAQDLVDAANEAGVHLSVLYQTRHHPSARVIREELAAGAIGRLELVRASLGMGLDPLSGWRADPESAGAGALYNLGVHVLDTVRFLVMLPVVSVSAVTTPPDDVLDRTVLVQLGFQGGVLGTVIATQSLARETVAIELEGSRGSITWTGWLAPYRSGEIIVATDGGERRTPSASPDAYVRLVRSFTASVRDGTPPEPSPTDVLETVRVTEATLTSARAGVTVSLDRRRAEGPQPVGDSSTSRPPTSHSAM